MPLGSVSPEYLIRNNMTLTLYPLRGLPLVNPGDDLTGLIADSLHQNNLSMDSGDIIVIAQKIISKAEDRFVNLTTVTPSEQAKKYANLTGKDPRLVELILSESSEVLRTRQNVMIVAHKLGFVCANAGIDHSNVSGPWGDADDWVLLLPVDPDETARSIREVLEREFQCKIGVLVIDSHGRSWRQGTAGVTIGISGMPGLVDLRGKPDLFDFQLKVTQVAAADELASAASLVMGQAREGLPVVLVKGFPYPLRESSLDELIRPKDLDLFR